MPAGMHTTASKACALTSSGAVLLPMLPAAPTLGQRSEAAGAEAAACSRP